MNKKIYIVLMVIAIIILSFMIVRKVANQSGDKVSNLDKYKNTYIGDNSKVSNILELLPYSEYKKSISLQTVSEPYGLTVTYNMNGSREIMKINSDKLFELIKNLGEITYIFNNQQVKVQRNEVY
ncbi:hypothetical protein D3C72_1722940 [compost metagenome]